MRVYRRCAACVLFMTVTFLVATRDARLSSDPYQIELVEKLSGEPRRLRLEDRLFDLNINKIGWGCPGLVQLRCVIECALVGCGQRVVEGWSWGQDVPVGIWMGVLR